MRKPCLFVILLVASFALFAGGAYAAPHQKQPKLMPHKSGDIGKQLKCVPGQLIIKFKDEQPGPEQTALMADLGIKNIKNLGASGTMLVSTPEGKSKDVLAKLRANKLVEYAVPNYVFRPFGVPNDFLFSRQWALDNTGQSIVDYYSGTLIPGTPDVDINAPEAWKEIKKGHQVLVGVLDTGVDVNHPDLRDSIWVNPGEIPGDGIDNDGNGYIDDIHGWNFAGSNGAVFSNFNEDGHGTSVAGVIAAGTGHHVGITGAAPNVKIVCLKFIGPTGEGSLSDVILALDYARKIGVKIINASWGGYFPTSEADPEFYEYALRPLAEAILASDALFVAAAGNDGLDLDALPDMGWQLYPAGFKYPNVISVTAVNNRGYLCTFESDGWASNRGPNTVDIAAPGSNVVTTLSLDPLGASVEGVLDKSRTACWGFGLEDVVGPKKRAELLRRELKYLLPEWDSANTKNAPKILLVDDDNSETGYPDCNGYWMKALDTLGVSYQVYRVPSYSGSPVDGPSVADMVHYNLVIWQAGRDFESSPLTVNDTANLAEYLNQGGNLLLSGENAIRGNEDWAQRVLQAQFVFEGLPCYDLSGLVGTTCDGFNSILDGTDFGIPPALHDVYIPANPNTARIGLTYRYAYISGTSIAAPHVAAVAALLFGKDPQNSPGAVRQVIVESAKPLPDLAGKVASGGMVDASAALNLESSHRTIGSGHLRRKHLSPYSE